MPLRDAALAILCVADPAAKAAQARALHAQADAAALDPQPRLAEPPGLPGRPARPRLLPPKDVPARTPHTIEGRVALLHAIAHIEFNAINLAWDAVYRFRDMPGAYYDDWIGVAADEARHFAMLEARLRELGHAYGDFDAHDGLWDMAVKTAGSCLERMALVPRVLEARGLDVTPGMIERLRGAGDTATIAILEVILAEEVAHVAAGSRWFEHCCAAAGVEPRSTFAALVARLAPGAVRAPFNHEARERAGFAPGEVEALTG